MKFNSLGSAQCVGFENDPCCYASPGKESVPIQVPRVQTADQLCSLSPDFETQIQQYSSWNISISPLVFYSLTIG
jgi:hypothetical protein